MKEIIPRYFGDTFDAMYGECEGIPRKPDPTGLLRVIDELEVTPDNCAYVGDSAGDMKVAVAAGCLPLGVSWGYNDTDSIKSAGAATIINDAEELLQFSK